MTRPGCRPDPTRPRTDAVEGRRETCTHPPEYRQPGGLCGCCGRDEFGGDWTEQDSIDLSARLVARDGHRLPLVGAERLAAVRLMVGAGLVARDGHRLPLVGAERLAAVRLMVGAGLDTATIADRLCISVDALVQWALRQHVQLSARKPRDWWVLYVSPSRSAKYRRQIGSGYGVRRVAA